MHPKRPKGIPIHFPSSQSGDASRGPGEKALRAVRQLPAGLQPVAIPRRGPPTAPRTSTAAGGQRRFVKVNGDGQQQQQQQAAATREGQQAAGVGSSRSRATSPAVAPAVVAPPRRATPPPIPAPPTPPPAAEPPKAAPASAPSPAASAPVPPPAALAATPSPLPLPVATAAAPVAPQPEADADDSDSDVDAALAEAQRKLAELQERKRKRALRKSLAADQEGHSGSEASSSLAPAAAAAAVQAAPTILQPKPEPVDAVVPASEQATAQGSDLPAVEDAPAQVGTPYGTSSQVIFSDLPTGCRELALRRFIGGTLVSVLSVDFQESFALVSFANDHDAAEVVRMLTGEEFAPGVVLPLDLASNLELVTEEELRRQMEEAAAAGAEAQGLAGDEGQQLAMIDAALETTEETADAAPITLAAAATDQLAPPSPHNSLFSSQRHSPSPQPTSPSRFLTTSAPPPPPPPPASDEAPSWAAYPSRPPTSDRKRQRSPNPASATPSASDQQQQQRVKVEPKFPCGVVDLTLCSDDEGAAAPRSTASTFASAITSPPKRSERKKLKYSAPELSFGPATRLSKERAPKSKTRWIARGEKEWACCYHRGVVEVFDKASKKPLPPVQLALNDGESIEGLAFAGDRVIIGRSHQKVDGVGVSKPAQISWISVPSLRKAHRVNKPEKVKTGTLLEDTDSPHGMTGIASITTVPSTALSADSPPSTAVFASGGFDHSVRLWKLEAAGKRKIWTLHDSQHTSRVDALVWAEDQKYLWSGGADGRILAFDLSHAQLADWKLPRSSTGVFHLHVSPSHPALLLAEINRQYAQFMLYDSRQPSTQTAVEFGDAPPPGANGTEGGTSSKTGRSRYIAGSWQGNIFASPEQNGVVKFWDVRNASSSQPYELQPRATQMRQVLFDDSSLLDFTGEALFVRDWSLS